MRSALRQEQTAQHHEQIGKLLSFQDEKSFYRKTYINWDTIERAKKNDNAVHSRTKLLSSRAKDIAAVAVGKLTKGHRVFFNHKYLSTITFCTRRQNLRLIDQLRYIFEITCHNTVTHNGKKYRHCYEFAFKSEKPVNTTIAENSIETNKPCNEETLLIEEENKHIEDIDLISNFLNNSSLQIQTENPNLHDNSPVKNLVKKAVIKNKRYKTTNAQKKARIYRPLFNNQYPQNQYPQTKNLAEHHPLTSADCSDLQSRSGRDFTLNAMNEILLALSNKPKESAHEFPSKEAFLAYMSKIYRYEKRDAVETSRLNYQIKANMTESDVIEQTNFAQREKFLDKIETEAIMHVCLENQLKAKLVGRLEQAKAYQLLSSFKRFEVVGDIMQIHLNKRLELTENDKEIILSQVQAVYSTASGINVECIDTIEFIFSEKVRDVKRQCSIQTNYQKESVELPKGVWGNIRKALIVEYGEDVDRNWFSKLTATVDDINKNITLKAENGMTKDWIVGNYKDILERIIAISGFELDGLEC